MRIIAVYLYCPSHLTGIITRYGVAAADGLKTALIKEYTG